MEMNAQQNLLHITHMLATLIIVCITFHTRDVSSCKAKIGTSTPTPCYKGLFRSKNMKESVYKTFLFCHGDQRRCVGGQTKYGILAKPPMPNVWHVKISIYLIIGKVSVLEGVGFRLACYGNFDVVCQCCPSI